MEHEDQGSVGSDGSHGSATASLKSIEEELDFSFEKVLDGLSNEEKEDARVLDVDEVVINTAARPWEGDHNDDEVAFLLSGDGDEDDDDDSDASSASSDAPSETLETVKLAQEELDRRFAEDSQFLAEEGGDSQARIIASNLMEYSSTYSTLYRNEGIEELQDDLSAASVVDKEQDQKSLYVDQGLDSLQADLAMADASNDQTQTAMSREEEPVFLGSASHPQHHQMPHIGPEFTEGDSNSEMPRATSMDESTISSNSEFLVEHDLSTASSSDALPEDLLWVEEQLNRRIGSFLADEASEEMDLDGGAGNSDLGSSHFSAIRRDRTADIDLHQQRHQPPNSLSSCDFAACTPSSEEYKLDTPDDETPPVMAWTSNSANRYCHSSWKNSLRSQLMEHEEEDDDEDTNKQHSAEMSETAATEKDQMQQKDQVRAPHAEADAPASQQSSTILHEDDNTPNTPHHSVSWKRRRVALVGLLLLAVMGYSATRASLTASKHPSISRKGRRRRNTRMLVVRRDSESKASVKRSDHDAAELLSKPRFHYTWAFRSQQAQGLQH